MLNLMKGHAILCVLIGLLACTAANDDVDSLKVQLSLLKNSYRQLCERYSNLSSNCSAPEYKCTQCPDNWLHVGDHCFFLSSQRHNFTDGSQMCSAMGSHLAILTTKEQHDAVEKEGRRIAGLYIHYWIGLSDAETEGEWKWVDNSTLTVPFWNELKSEPDNNLSGGEEGENCAVVDSYNQLWYDVPCSFMYPSVCQMDASPLE